MIGTTLGIVVTTVIAGLLLGVLVVSFNPNIKNKAGPPWIWRLGRFDPFRNLFFREDGSFRRFGRIGLVAIVAPCLIVALFALTILLGVFA